MAVASEQIAVAFRKACTSLGLSAKFNRTQLREAYLRLAKQYHPDSGSLQADSDKFTEIENAYHFLKAHENDSSGRPNSARGEVSTNELQELLDRHTSARGDDDGNFQPKAPHRTNLSFVFKQREVTNAKVTRAQSNVANYRVRKAMQSANDLVPYNNDLQIARKLKISSTIERVVEDLVQEAISSGQFENLKGTGQPLRSSADENPLIDTSTHYLNKVLIQNGYLPEWVTLRNEISHDEQLATHRFAKALLNANTSEDARNEALATFRDDVMLINKKVRRLNLLVPLLGQQIFEFDVDHLITAVQSEPNRYVLSDVVFGNSEQQQDRVSDESSGTLGSWSTDFSAAFRQFRSELGKILSYPFRRTRSTY